MSGPEWEVILDLLGHHGLLDPRSVAMASCVSRSWKSVLSSDHIWLPLCRSHYPSLADDAYAVSPRRIFALLRTSSSRRTRAPRAPRIPLSRLIFAVDVFDLKGMPVFSVARRGDRVLGVCDGMFRFDVEEEERRNCYVEGGEARVVWNVVMEGWEGAFLMMDRVGKGRLSCGTLWFSETLPGPACCSKAIGGLMGGGLVAELGFRGGFGDNDGAGGVEKVSFGVMSASECRYLSVDDALLYLQPFLLPHV